MRTTRAFTQCAIFRRAACGQTRPQSMQKWTWTEVRLCKPANTPTNIETLFRTGRRGHYLSGTGDLQRDSRESIRTNHSQIKAYFYSASGRFARMIRISDSRESPDSRESCESIRANHATKVITKGVFSQEDPLESLKSLNSLELSENSRILLSFPQPGDSLESLTALRHF